VHLTLLTLLASTVWYINYDTMLHPIVQGGEKWL
jgi:hypothetical protein